MSSEILLPPVLTLPEGLVGLPNVRELDVLPVAGGAFVELVVRAEPGLGWLAAAADDVRPGMTDALVASGRIAPDEALVVLLASHGEPAVVTANLAGPIAVGPAGFGRQLVLEDPAYEIRARLGRLAPAPASSD